MENCALWHERDMSHSSVERVLLPQAFVLTDYMLAKARELLENLQIYPERMLARLLGAQGLPFSEGLLLALVRKGMSRREAHALVTQLSAQAVKENRALSEVAAAHPQLGKLLDPGELGAIFELREWLSGVEEAFRRVPPPG
jgi:adenylosuccinate lyase